MVRFCHMGPAPGLLHAAGRNAGTCPASRTHAPPANDSSRRRPTEGGGSMARHRRRMGAIGIALTSDQWARLDGFKSGILLLLGAWIAYFVVVDLFIRTLDRIIVPVLGVPLSALVVAQGSALLFLGALYVLARGRSAAE